MRRRKLAYAGPTDMTQPTDPEPHIVAPQQGLAIAPSGHFSADPACYSCKETFDELASIDEGTDETPDVHPSIYQDPIERDMLRQQFRTAGIDHDDPKAIREGFDWEDLHGYED